MPSSYLKEGRIIALIVLYDDEDTSIIKICLKLMNVILGKGILVLLLVHPLLSLYILNIIFVMCLHEALHLGIERKIKRDKSLGLVVLNSYSLSVILDEIPHLLSILSPFILGPVGVMFSYFLKSLNMNLNLILCLRLACLPWTLNCINFVWFSPDMKTLKRAIKNL